MVSATRQALLKATPHQLQGSRDTEPPVWPPNHTLQKGFDLTEGQARPACLPAPTHRNPRFPKEGAH